MLRLRAPKRERTARVVVVLVALLATLPFLVHGPGTSFFVVDDPQYVINNQQVRQGFDIPGLLWAGGSFHAMNWHPLTWISHMLDVSFFGLDARGHHVTSIVLHGCVAGLLSLALARLTGSLVPSLLVAALFAVHPLRVESVVWIAERKDVLAGFFFVLTLLAWERYVRRGGSARYGTALALLALGLMAKPMLVTVPPLLLLLDFWPLGRLFAGSPGTRGLRSGVILEKVPFAIVAAASAALTVVAQRSGGAVQTFETFPLAARLANAAVAVAAYLEKTLWPAGLTVFYPFPPDGTPGGKLALVSLLLVALSAAAVLSARRRPALLAGWLWFLGMLVPVIGLVQVGGQGMADRYTYLPSIGLLVALAWGIPRVSRTSGAPAALILVAGAVVVSAFAAATIRQVGLWSSNVAILRHSLAAAPQSSLLKLWLSEAYVSEGRESEGAAVRGDMFLAMGLFPQALEAYQEMLAATEMPTAAEHLRIGRTFRGLGRKAEAAAAFSRALETDPGSPEAHLELGLLLVEMGEPSRSRTLLERHLALRPGSAEAHNALGLVLQEVDREAAARHFAEAIALKDDFAVARFNLVLTRLRLGDRAGARRELQQLRARDPALADELEPLVR